LHLTAVRCPWRQRSEPTASGSACVHRSVFGQCRFSDAVRGFDRDTIAFTGIPGPIRDYEANLEISYMAQIVPGWTIQPNVQRIWHPSGDGSRNAIVTGVRSLWRF
jgi:carbohydrate-selective porin OprB